MTPFDQWLRRVTKHLSQQAVTQVGAELREHYESEREALLAAGTPAEEAARQALAALGDAEALNREYRKVHLTAAEARLLRQGNCEARMLCATTARKRALIALPLAIIAAALPILFTSPAPNRTPWILLTAGLAIGTMFAAPSLPIYTPSRARIFRVIRYTMLIAILGFALQWSTLILTGLWPLIYIEFIRASLRRKLPVTQWPKQLYL